MGVILDSNHNSVVWFKCKKGETEFHKWGKPRPLVATKGGKYLEDDPAKRPKGWTFGVMFTGNTTLRVRRSLADCFRNLRLRLKRVFTKMKFW